VRSYSHPICNHHFEFVWAWHITLRHLRHHKKGAWAPLAVGENASKNPSVQEIHGCIFCTPAACYVTKIRPLFEGLGATRIRLHFTIVCSLHEIVFSGATPRSNCMFDKIHYLTSQSDKYYPYRSRIRDPEFKIREN